MKLAPFIASLAAIAALAIPTAPAPAQQSAAQRDWTRTVERTPEGGFRMGNPAAPVKVIEFLSLTCPHCAEFAAESGARLFPDYVRSGRVSVEYRNYTLNGFDLAAAFLSRCASPHGYFDMTHYLLGHQPEWMGRIRTLSEAQRAELRAATPLQAMQRLVPLLGLDRIAARHGITPAQQRTCLADQAGLDRIEQTMLAARRQHQVSGTPTFVINGRVAETNVWAGIEPLLRAR